MYICSMFTEKQLEQLQKLFQINNKVLIRAIGEDTKKEIQLSNTVLERKLMKVINESQKDTLIQVQDMITNSQKDTIEVLMDAIHTGYNMHDKRIKRLEDELDLSPVKQ